MSDTPLLTDRTALARNRARAANAPALFLHEIARDDLQDRLISVNRVFTAPAVVTPFPQIWEGVLENAVVIADDEILDLREGAHDLIIHALALHWSNDPLGQLIQMRRALRPDGLCLSVLFGGQTLHELRSAVAQAEAAVTGGLSPRVVPMAEIRDLGALLQRAGFALPVADAAPLTVAYQSLFHLAHDLRAMGEANALQGRLRTPTRREVLLRAADLYAQGYAAQDGRLPATFEVITLTGWAPDGSQQQPLRPGSAAHRLAEALGTQETKFKD
ncbi:MAG: methyltransferase domain-containing protein [Rhodobacteraceae bacterium]|nr:methyltransferase domain-containing protein [Paracoccaceae bacterium]